MKFQLTLLNMLLLTTAVALGVLFWLQSSQNQWYESRLPGLRDAARELDVTDPELLHVVESHPEWFGEKVWRIHVPTSGTYQLNMVTEDILWSIGEKEFPTAEVSVTLAAGTHKVELQQKRGEVIEVEVLVDDESAFLVKKDSSWYPQNVGLSSTSDVSNCESFAAGEEVRLIHSKISVNGKTVTGESYNGVLLWVSGR